MGKHSPGYQAKYQAETYNIVKVTFRKDDELYDRVKDISIVTKKSVPEIMRIALQEWLDNHNL